MVVINDMNEEFKKKINSYIGQKVINKTISKKAEKFLKDPEKLSKYIDDIEGEVKELKENYNYYKKMYRDDEIVLKQYREKDRRYEQYRCDCYSMFGNLRSILIIVEQEKGNEEYEYMIKRIDELIERGRNI